MANLTLGGIESQLMELEDNIAKLRKSLRHWQTLEIDYEGLREEFQILPEDTTQEECLQAAKDFKPELVDDKELQNLIGAQKTTFKRPSQLVDVLSKRVDYVTRNISTIRKQISDAEKKRNVLLLAQNPEHQDAANLPLSEITEELDEDGKVISSKVEMPGKKAPDLLELLRKAGVPDVQNEEKTEDVSAEGAKIVTSNSNKSDAEADDEGANSIPRTMPTFTQCDIVKENSDDENVDSDDGRLGPANPDDTETDAALRQEMLRYGLGEVGAIVAELDLQDATTHPYDEDDEDDYLSDYDEDDDLYTDESEDERGATKTPVISERYKRQMEALSKKHGITDLKNLGPDPHLPEGVKEQLDRPSAAEAARKAAIAREEAVKSALKPLNDEDEPHKKKKKVAFAASLDIAKDGPTDGTAVPTQPIVNPVGDIVIERESGHDGTPTIPPSTNPSETPKKPSRFKAARQAAPPTPMFPPPMDFPSSTKDRSTPEGPPGRTISDVLVERPASKITAPTDPSDFDEELHRKEVAIEYQKMRNRKIHDQGGYVRGGMEENYGEEMSPAVILDQNSGKPRKISRFKAARLQSGT